MAKGRESRPWPKWGFLASKDMRRIVHRNGVVEFVGPGTGEHMVVMEGMTVETHEADSLAIVSVAATITCGACFKRWLLPVAEYKNGWSECRHCKTRLFLPPIYLPNRQGRILKPSGK